MSTLRKRLPVLAIAAASVATAAIAQTSHLSTASRSDTKAPDLMSGLSAALFGYEHDAHAPAPNRKGPYFWESGRWTAAYGKYVEKVAPPEAGRPPRRGLPAGSTWGTSGRRTRTS